MIDEKRVLPGLRPLLKMAPRLDLNAPLEALRRTAPNPIKEPERVQVWDELVPANGTTLRVRFYRPAFLPQGQQLGVFYWIHGGGLLAGSVEMDDGLCALFAERAGILVASVEYRLAPEYPFPIPVEDCYAVLLWLAEQQERLSFDASKIAVGGASAGGGLCVAVTLITRDRNDPAIFFQMPLYPMLDDRSCSPSCREIDSEAMPITWNGDVNRVAWSWYLSGYTGEIPEYAAPARAKNLSGLPPTYTCIGQLDPFRDETLEFVTRLCRAGVDVEFHLYPGGYHGYDQIPLNLEEGARMREGYIAALAKAFNE